MARAGDGIGSCPRRSITSGAFGVPRLSGATASQEKEAMTEKSERVVIGETLVDARTLKRRRHA
jgi:hypothetical protein